MNSTVENKPILRSYNDIIYFRGVQLPVYAKYEYSKESPEIKKIMVSGGLDPSIFFDNQILNDLYRILKINIIENQ